ncbi:MAG: HlyD family secretion protein [Gammaproteobacteria bacterium]|nr:MAG: HlyD family secretion protein [Gammaproteobacteria bacterium]
MSSAGSQRNDTPGPGDATPPAASRRTTNLVAAALALVTIIGLTWWVLHRIAYVHVVDARIAATMVAVSSRANGWIEVLAVEEGDQVEAGDLLFAVDDREARLLLAEREAQIERLQAHADSLRERQAMVDARTASRLDTRRSELNAAEAALRAADSEYERAVADWQRATPMLEREIISRQVWERQRNDHLQARSRREAAVADLARTRAELAEAEAERSELRLIDAEIAELNHALTEARAQRDRQAVLLDDHQVRSPGRGVIDEVFVERGEHVNRGQRLLVMHNTDEVWISANVKETELRHFDTGAQARVRVDAYPRARLAGRVTRIGSAATSEFALLPSPNPSGNFTKITQRVKIRIDLDDPGDLTLRPGMMVEVAIEK